MTAADESMNTQEGQKDKEDQGVEQDYDSVCMCGRLCLCMDKKHNNCIGECSHFAFILKKNDCVWTYKVEQHSKGLMWSH